MSIVIDDEKLQQFNSLMSGWLRNIHNDIHVPGIMNSNLISMCGIKLVGLKHCIMLKSTEISTIRINKLQYTNTWMQILRRTLYFICETFLPLISALTVLYTLYNFIIVDNKRPGPIHVQTIPIPLNNSSLIDYAYYYGKISYNAVKPFVSINAVTNMIGTFTGRIVRATSLAGSSFIDESLGIRNTTLKVTAFCIATIASVLVYKIITPFTGVIANGRNAIARKENVILLQTAFICEYEAAIEQSLYQLLTLPVIAHIENLLHMSSKSASPSDHQQCMSIINIYTEDYANLYYSILTPYEKQINMMDVNDVLRASKPSSQFIILLFRLIRESNDALAQHLMTFNQSLIEAPITARNSVLATRELAMIPLRSIGNAIMHTTAPIITGQIIE